MSQFLDRLNLRPQERRILVGVTTIVLVVLNAALVWPHFKDVAAVKVERKKALATLKQFQEEVARIPEYEARTETLAGQGSAVLPAEQANQLMRTVQNLALQHNVAITQTRVIPTPSTTTNIFFDEQAVVVSVNTGERQVVDFLLALGGTNTMIRARDLDLRPDPPQFKLNGSITLIASYQKKAKAPATPPARPLGPGAVANRNRS
jgi:hypothetical protein